MFKRHKIGDPPEWQRHLLVFLGGMVAATLLLVAVWAVFILLDQTT